MREIIFAHAPGVNFGANFLPAVLLHFDARFAAVEVADAEIADTRGMDGPEGALAIGSSTAFHKTLVDG